MRSIAYANVAFHLLGLTLGATLMRPSSITEPLDARVAVLAAHPGGWQLGWAVWMLSALTFVAFMERVTRGKPDARLALLLGAMGATVDLFCDAIQMCILPQFAAEDRVFVACERIANLGGLVVANGLYSIAVLVATRHLHGFVVAALGSLTFVAGMILVVAGVLDSPQLVVLSAGPTILAYCAWVLAVVREEAEPEPALKTAVVFGGYGVFGSHVARELAKRGVPVVVAGRDQAKAERFAAEIGARGIAADVKKPPADLVNEEHVIVDCAGPFSVLGTELLEACARQGAHHVDIADDRGYAARVRALAPRFERSAAVYGCPSLPAISIALLRAAIARKPARVRITLFIGNDNPKGEAAIRSLVEQLGRPFEAPQGELTGMGNGETVELPVFGRRRVYDFECSDYDLIPVPSVSVKVGFELGLVTRAFALLGRISSRWGARTARFLAWLGGPRWGRSGGVVQVELFSEDGTARRGSLSGREHGQRMAALPAALVAEALAKGHAAKGALLAPDLLGARELLDAIAAEGFVLELPDAAEGSTS